MKSIFVFTLVMLFSTACGKTEQSFKAKFSHIDNSALLQRIETSIPEGIDITNISEIKQGVIISGKAESNKIVKLFMDNISKQKIDTPNLRSIKRDSKKQSLFELEVINYPVNN